MIALKPAERELRHGLITEVQSVLNGKKPFPLDFLAGTYAGGDSAVLDVMLYHVDRYETEHGRYALSSFAGVGKQSDWADVRQFWQHTPITLVDMLDFQTDMLMAELAKLKQLGRYLAHGGDE